MSILYLVARTPILYAPGFADRGRTMSKDDGLVRITREGLITSSALELRLLAIQLAWIKQWWLTSNHQVRT